MNKAFAITSILLFCFNLCISQNVDSLKNVLLLQKNYPDRQETLLSISNYYNTPGQINDDSIRKYAVLGLEEAQSQPINQNVILLMGLKASSLYFSDHDSFFAINRRAVHLADSLKLMYDAAYHSYRITVRHYNNGHFDSSLVYGLQSENYLKREHIKDAKFRELRSKQFSMISGTFHSLGDFPKAMAYAHEGENFAIANNDSLGIQKSLLNLGAIYGSVQEKKHLFRDSIEGNKYKTLARKYIVDGYNFSKNVPAFHQRGYEAMNLALLTLEDTDTTGALKYLEEALFLGERQNQLRVKLNALNEIALIHISRGQLSKALENIERCDSLLISSNSNHYMSALLLVKAKYFEKSKQHKKALTAFDAAEKIAIDSQNKINIRRNYLQRYEYLKGRNDAKEALKYYEKYVAIRDSITSQSDLADMAYLVKQNELLKEKNEINLLNTKNLKDKLRYRNQFFLALFLSFVAIAVALILWLINRTRTAQYEKRAINLEQRLLRSQMNPHFTFNTLGSIQNYLLQSGQTKKGAYYLAKFAKLMRQILSQSRSEVITLEEEIDTLENYLALQQLRFDNKFDYQITVEPDIDVEGTKIPPMMIQPIIENSIEHGKIHTVENGKIEIRIIESNGILKVEIEDNGIGRVAAHEINKVRQHKSVSMDIIKERIAIMKKKYGKLIGFEISDKSNRGTKVIFDLPYITQ